MLEAIRNHSRILMYILVPLIIGSFIFVGAESYLREGAGANTTVAVVDGKEIHQGEWDNHFRESLETFRRQAPNVDLRMLETPEMKRAALDELVRERVFQTAAAKGHFGTSDERLLHFYKTDPQFAPFRGPDGVIDRARLEAAVTQQGMTVPGMEARLRDMIALRQVQQVLGLSAIAPDANASRAFDALYQQREVQLLRFEPAAYTAKVVPTAAEVDAFYKDPKNAVLFQSTEQADIEYVVLDLDAAKKAVTVSEDDLKTYYDQNEKRFTVPEERRVRHILVAAGTSVSDADRTAAKAKAEALRAEVVKAPATFADVARKNSQDVGTAERGGELDTYIGRGDTEKAYETALFALKVNDISPVIATSEGFYVTQLLAVRGGEKRSYASVHDEIAEELRKQKAQLQFAQAAEEFTNAVYEQPDALKPIADKLKLELKTAKAVTRTPAQGGDAVLANAKFLEALFADDTLRAKHNTKAVEIKANQLAAGRVVQYRPAALRPLADVRADVQQRLVATQAAALARKDGLARFETAKAAPATALSTPVVTVSRAKSEDLPRELLDAALRAPSTGLPAVVGVDLGDRGYAVVRVTKVLGRDTTAADPKQTQSQYAQAWAAAESDAYYEALRARYKVKVSVPATTGENSANGANGGVSR